MWIVIKHLAHLYYDISRYLAMNIKEYRVLNSKTLCIDLDHIININNVIKLKKHKEGRIVSEPQFGTIYDKIGAGED